MDKDIFSKIGSKLKNLPTLPSVAAKILEVTEKPDSTINEVREIISMDQVVASRLLKAVNSAYYGFPRKIDSLSQAIVILGFNNVRSLALSVAVMDVFSAKYGGSFSLSQLWHHSVGTAFIARALARTSFPQLSEQCFVAGLLHDIGFIPIDQIAPGQLKMVMRHAEDHKIPVYQAERQVLGFTHADVGNYMAEVWLLPTTLKEAISLHHEPPADAMHPPILLAVHAADILARMRNFSSFDTEMKGSLDEIVPLARTIFKIKDDMPPDAEEFLADDIEQARGFLNIFK